MIYITSIAVLIISFFAIRYFARRKGNPCEDIEIQIKASYKAYEEALHIFETVPSQKNLKAVILAKAEHEKYLAKKCYEKSKNI